MPYAPSVPQGLALESEALRPDTKLFLQQVRASTNLIYRAKPNSIVTASTNVLTQAWLGVAMQAGSRLTVNATIQGTTSTGAAYGTYRLNASFFRALTGAAIQLGATTVIYSRESNAAVDATLSITANSAPQVLVNDGAQGTFTWDVFVEGYS